MLYFLSYAVETLALLARATMFGSIIRFMKIYDYTVLMTPDVTGGYVVTCPALPGLVTQGDTLEDARANAAEAIDLYLEVLLEDGEPIPADVTLIIEPLSIKVA